MAPYTKSALEEELRRPDSLPAGLPWRLLIFMAIAFCTMAALYLGMTLGYKPYLNSQIETLDQKIGELSRGIDEKQQENLISFYSQLINIDSLLDSHPKSSKFFDFLEKNTSSKIYYNSMDLSLVGAGGDAKLNGTASNYSAIAEQIELFSRSSGVSKISLDSSSAGDSGIDFSVSLSLTKEAFK